MNKKPTVRIGAGRLMTIKLLGFKMTFSNIREFLVILKTVFLHKEYIFHSQKNEPFIIDCGSHIGLSILFFKKKFPNAHILGFEPNPATFKILEKNVKQNNLRNVKLINAAVSDKDSTVNFITNMNANKILRRRGSNWAWNDFIEGSKSFDSIIHKKIEVPGVKLSSFIDREVDFLKIDIEGSEGKVIREIEDKLPLTKEIIMEFHGNSANKSNNLEAILRILERNSFSYHMERRGKVVDGQNDNRTYPYFLNIRFKKSGNYLSKDSTRNAIRKKLSISVGIPAYNEEANIKNLLESLVLQKETNFRLKEIIVISDGSTDNTLREIRKVNDKRIKVVAGRKRYGQAERQNQIFDKASGDFLVLLNADVLLEGNHFLSSMMETYQHAKNTDLVGSKTICLSSNATFERILEWQKAWKRQIYEHINGADNIYLCHGRGRGFSRKAYRKIRWPHVSSEDAYSYLASKKLGFKFIYCRQAVVLYQSPKNLKDQVRQSVRFLSASKNLAPYFSKEELKTAYAIPKKILITAMLKGLIGNPFKAMAYVAIYSYCKMITATTKPSNDYYLWEGSVSTKKLQANTINVQ